MKSIYKSTNLVLVLISFISTTITAQENLQWPCGQYVTRQELISGSTYKSVVNVLYTTATGTVGLDKVCENTSHLFNAAAFYDGYIWAWKQYTGTSQTGTSSSLMRLNNDCTVTEYIITFPSGTSTAQFNNAYVDASGNFYMARPGSFPNIIVYKINLNTLVAGASPATNTLTATTFVPNGTAFTGTGNFGDMYFNGTTAYIWQNGQGLASLNLSTNTYTRIGAVDEVAGSLFINASDPGFLYGYGTPTTGTSTQQNTIVKIDIATGNYTEVAAGGAAVSQSDGAGCPTATFEEPDPVANPDESLNNMSGSTVKVSPITNNDVVVGGTINMTTVSLVPPAGATDIVRDANGDIISMTIPGEGTWFVDPATGDISFDPLPTFTNDPTVISYNVADDKGNKSNDTTVTVTYLAAPLPISLIRFTANIINENIVLSWKTANEKNFSYFEIQKSANTKEFSGLGKVSSSNTTIYNLVDDRPMLGANYYRLKMVDNDGTFTYSNIISVEFKKDANYITFQNPVKSGIIEVITNYKKASFNLVNSFGHIVNRGMIVNNSALINVSSLNSGMYYLSILAEGKIITQKVMIQN